MELNKNNRANRRSKVISKSFYRSNDEKNTDAV
jgi:hypothetical protein